MAVKYRWVDAAGEAGMGDYYSVVRSTRNTQQTGRSLRISGATRQGWCRKSLVTVKIEVNISNNPKPVDVRIEEHKTAKIHHKEAIAEATESTTITTKKNG